MTSKSSCPIGGRTPAPKPPPTRSIRPPGPSGSLAGRFRASNFAALRPPASPVRRISRDGHIVPDKKFHVLQPMCWNAPVSFATLGLGTLFNLISYYALRERKTPTSLLVWAWQYALLMQGVAWLQLEAGDDIHVASRVAMVLNVTQPLALFLTYICEMRVVWCY